MTWCFPPQTTQCGERGSGYQYGLSRKRNPQALHPHEEKYDRIAVRLYEPNYRTVHLANSFAADRVEEVRFLELEGQIYLGPDWRQRLR